MRPVYPSSKHTTDSDCRAIESAMGYYELGMFDDAHAEIERLSPKVYCSKGVLSLRASVYAEANWWERLYEVARVLVNKWPGECDHWILLGCASRRCQSIAESNDVLLEALIFHEFEPLIYFYLACNSASSGDVASARHQLTNALLLDPEIGNIAMEDADLAPVWLEMERKNLQIADFEFP
jgi:predicted Zn-dependent protease